MIIDIFRDENAEDLSKIVYTEDGSGVIVAESNENILYGRAPEGENEIAVSMEIAEILYYHATEKEIDFSREALADPSDEIQEALSKVLNCNYYFEANEVKKCTIVGIHDGISYNIITTDEWYDQLMEVLPNYLECYCNDTEGAKNFKNSNLAKTYAYVSNYEERFENAVAVTKQWGIVYAISLVIVFAICILLLHSYANIDYGYLSFVVPLIPIAFGSVITGCVALADTKVAAALGIADALKTRN